MPAPLLTSVPFADLAATLPQLPARAGVGQILAADGRSLLIGRAANLRRWFATHLGGQRPRGKGKRPPTDLSPLAVTLASAETTSAFHQRLVFERLMGEHVPLAARRDLKTPAYLHLDPSERFPRVTVRPAGEGPLYGPFRDRRAAQRAREALHKIFPLRPCDYVFEPDPALPLGLGCLYAQVRSCAAPCLVRVGEAEYREIAARAADLLGDTERHGADVGPWLPPWVARADCGLIVEQGGAGLELYPVRHGGVLDAAAICCAPEELQGAVARLSWNAAAPPPNDQPWLSAWLYGPRKSGALLPVLDQDDRGTLAERVKHALASPTPSRRRSASSPA